jgi:hypothetical protein
MSELKNGFWQYAGPERDENRIGVKNQSNQGNAIS